MNFFGVAGLPTGGQIAFQSSVMRRLPFMVSALVHVRALLAPEVSTKFVGTRAGRDMSYPDAIIYLDRRSSDNALRSRMISGSYDTIITEIQQNPVTVPMQAIAHSALSAPEPPVSASPPPTHPTILSDE